MDINRRYANLFSSMNRKRRTFFTRRILKRSRVPGSVTPEVCEFDPTIRENRMNAGRTLVGQLHVTRTACSPLPHTSPFFPSPPSQKHPPEHLLMLAFSLHEGSTRSLCTKWAVTAAPNAALYAQSAHRPGDPSQTVLFSVCVAACLSPPRAGHRHTAESSEHGPEWLTSNELDASRVVALVEAFLVRVSCCAEWQKCSKNKNKKKDKGKGTRSEARIVPCTAFRHV